MQPLHILWFKGQGPTRRLLLTEGQLKCGATALLCSAAFVLLQTYSWMTAKSELTRQKRMTAELREQLFSAEKEQTLARIYSFEALPLTVAEPARLEAASIHVPASVPVAASSLATALVPGTLTVSNVKFKKKEGKALELFFEIHNKDLRHKKTQRGALYAIFILEDGQGKKSYASYPEGLSIDEVTLRPKEPKACNRFTVRNFTSRIFRSDHAPEGLRLRELRIGLFNAKHELSFEETYKEGSGPRAAS